MSLPVLKIEGETLPEVWEKSIIEVWKSGSETKTEYDKEGDPPTKEATVIMVVNNPLQEPRIHKGALCGGYDDLEKYKHEVINGVRDHWVNPSEGKWLYTYSMRLTDYSSLPEQNKGEKLHWDSDRIDQIEKMYQKILACGYTRRAQAVTWDANIDMDVYDPPCLQRFWIKLIDDALVWNTHFRSNDAFKAAFMNIWAFVEWFRMFTERLSNDLGREIKMGRYCHIVDSYHIYGSYAEEVNNFLETLKSRTWEERTVSSLDENVQYAFAYGREVLVKEKQKELNSGIITQEKYDKLVYAIENNN